MVASVASRPLMGAADTSPRSSRRIGDHQSRSDLRRPQVRQRDPASAFSSRTSATNQQNHHTAVTGPHLTGVLATCCGTSPLWSGSHPSRSHITALAQGTDRPCVFTSFVLLCSRDLELRPTSSSRRHGSAWLRGRCSSVIFVATTRQPRSAVQFLHCRRRGDEDHGYMKSCQGLTPTHTEVASQRLIARSPSKAT